MNIPLKKIYTISILLLILFVTVISARADMSTIDDVVYLKFIQNQNPFISNVKAREILRAVKYYTPRYFGDDDIEGFEWTLSVIAQESSFRNINGDEGVSIGYMQIQEPTCDLARKHNGIKRDLNLHSMWPNIHCGMAELNRLYDKFDGDFELAIKAYNAGEGAVNRWLRKGTAYVKNAYIEFIIYRNTKMQEVKENHYVKKEQNLTIAQK